MIKKLKLGLLVAVLSLFAGASSANAVALDFSTNTNVTIGAYTYTILAGSAATALVNNGTTLVLTVPVSSTFTLLSADRHTLTTAVGTNTCTNTESTVVIAGSVTERTITPTATACGAITGGGGGGGGGGYVAPSDTTPPSATSISINAGVATASLLSSTLTLAATDATQMLISNDAGFAGASWETYATSKVWTLTSGDGVKTVYAKFRDATGNMSVAVSDTITVSGSGTVEVVVQNPAPTQGCSGGNLYNTSTGNLCVNNAGAQIAGCGNRTTGFSTTGAGSCIGNRSTSTTGTTYNLGTTTLKNGSKGESVKQLQKILNQLLNLGLVIDGKLGPKTIAVIKTWQKNHNLVADGLVGRLTKAAMKAEAE